VSGDDELDSGGEVHGKRLFCGVEYFASPRIPTIPMAAKAERVTWVSICSVEGQEVVVTGCGLATAVLEENWSFPGGVEFRVRESEVSRRDGNNVRSMPGGDRWGIWGLG